jgi:hypothetical protein
MHPRKHRRVRTSAEEHRTPVSTSPELPRRHAGSPGESQVPPREVRASARSRDGEDPGTGKGPVPTRVQTLLYAPRSGGDPPQPRVLWLVTYANRPSLTQGPYDCAVFAFIAESTRRLPPR